MTTTGRVQGEPGGDDLAALDRAITALESQRSVLGDEVVDTALVPLQERRTALAGRTAGERRKLVTVVFADLVSFTDLSAWLDPEDTRTIVDAYFGRWRRAIEAHGGVVEKFIGDAVMAVFGLHQSWEDDAQRAVRAALAMVRELGALNEELARRFGVTLSMRVGIDTGDVVVSTLGDRGDDGFVVVGPTVNRAARLQAAAPVDRILLSADTRRLLRGRFSMEPRDGLVLKGFDEPVDGALVVSERPPGYLLDRPGGVEGVETTTVGRDAELRFLQERTWDVVEESHWKVVTVLGDAGVGKTRLLLDFDAWLAEWSETVYWFRGRASHDGGNRPNALLRDVVASRFAISESDEPSVVRRKMEAGFSRAYDGQGPDLAQAHRAAHVVAAWLGLDLGETSTVLPSDPQVLRSRATEALASYFSHLAAIHPVVVLLEDLHWADDGSLLWLDAAARWLADARVLVVATSRPSLLEERPRWSEGLAHHTRLVVSPLSRRQSRALLGQLLQHVEDPPDALVSLVIDSADGNPFYLEELVTWLIDSGVIVRGEPCWRVATDLIGSVVVPSSLRGVLQARLDALPGRERTLLQRASVVGRVFWDDAVQRLTATPEEVDTSSTLDGLRRRELVFEREVSAFDASREFLFKHALLRDVAYDGVLRAHRERYHRLAGDWLADVSARNGREDEYAALVAEHYDRAHEPEAGAWYLRAGRQAVSVFALDEATRLLERALALVDEPATRFDVLATREEVLDRQGERDAQRLDLMEMRALVDRLATDVERRVRLELASARLAFVTSDYEAAEEHARTARTRAAAAGLARQESEALLWHGKSCTWRDDGRGARDRLREALDVARTAGRGDVEAEALRYLGMLANNEGHYDEAIDLLERSRTVFVAHEDVEGEGIALAQLATTHFNQGRMDEAKGALEQVLPLFRRSGHRYREAIVLGNLATIECGQGMLASAHERAVEAAALTRAVDDREALTNNLLSLGLVLVAVARWEEATEVLEEALDLSREVESRTGETDALTLLALLRLERDQADDEALELAREAASVGELAASAMERGRAELAHGYAALAHDDDLVEEADEAFGAALESFSSLEVTGHAIEAAVGRAACARARGDVDEAVATVLRLRPGADDPALETMLRPGMVLLTCRDVLRSAAHEEAPLAAEQGRAYVDRVVAAIGDRAMAEGYLSRALTVRLRDDPAG